jgi:hypothetical protein
MGWTVNNRLCSVEASGCSHAARRARKAAHRMRIPHYDNNEVQHKTRHIYTRIQAHSITQCPKQNAVTSPNCYTVRGCNRYADTRIGAAAAAAAATHTCNSQHKRQTVDSNAATLSKSYKHTHTHTHTHKHKHRHTQSRTRAHPVPRTRVVKLEECAAAAAAAQNFRHRAASA